MQNLSLIDCQENNHRYGTINGHTNHLPKSPVNIKLVTIYGLH